MKTSNRLTVSFLGASSIYAGSMASEAAMIAYANGMQAEVGLFAIMTILLLIGGAAGLFSGIFG